MPLESYVHMMWFCETSAGLCTMPLWSLPTVWSGGWTSRWITFIVLQKKCFPFWKLNKCLNHVYVMHSYHEHDWITMLWRNCLPQGHLKMWCLAIE